MAMAKGQITAKTRDKLAEIERGVLTCNRCKETRGLDYFYKHSSRSYGYMPRCRRCVKEQDVIRRYGLSSLEEYEVYLRTPCPICGEPSSVLDHNHETGKVRDGLCSTCNMALGALRDDPKLLRRAASYLEAH